MPPAIDPPATSQVPPWSRGRRRWRRLWWIPLLAPVVIALLYAAALWWFQAALIYVPRSTTPTLAAAAEANGAERFRYAMGGREQVAWLVPPAADAPRVLWLACIGNAGCAADWFQQPGYLLPRLHRQTGAAILAVDFPGYGECPGEPDPAAILASTRAAQAAVLAHLGWTRDQVRIGAVGLSLGTGAASQHAAAEGLDRLVLIAPYTSLLDIAREQQPWPFWHLLRHRFDNRAGIAAIARRPGARVVIFHGDADRTIPVEHSRTLAREFPGVVRFHEFAGAAHHNVLDAALPVAVQEMAGLMTGE